MRAIRALNVAEKPSVAKAITDILSSRNATKRAGQSPYNPIFEFDYDIKGQQIHMVVTSVTGHMMNYAYPPEYKSWERVDPVTLFEAPVYKEIAETKINLKKTLEAEARGCQWLVLWLDCDREGENIAFEVVSVCKQANPRLNIIYRAHFSALIPAEIHRACQNLAKPNELDSLAVDARQELDLRIGAAFTRFQTMRFRNKFTGISEIVSYGPCQFPTLGFIVDRYWKHKVFKPEDYWGIKVVIDKDDQSASLNWDRKRLFDHASCLVLYELCVDNPTATVVQVNSKPTRKYRPFPLTTVQLQKMCAQKLKISSHDTMEIAERLYQQGFISYPRTETSKFSPNTDFRSLINVQKDDPVWGDYARRLLDQGFKNPKPGKTDDNSHPPIHPTKHALLDGRDKAVYELVVRHFLACCSDDALGQETTVEISIAGEMFHCKGLAITAYNFLEIYRYEKWSDKTIPNFKKGEQYLPSVLEMYHDKTNAPSCLTESELIQLMYDNGIGTDATIAEHIKKILQRQYCVKQGARSEFIPTKLGEALVAGYNAIGFRKLSLPQLRAQMELDMKGIGAGKKTKEQVVKENINVYKDIYVKVEQQARLLDEALGRYYQPLGSNNFTDEQRDFAQCGKCQNMMHLRNTGQKQVLYCEQCQLSLVVPNGELQATSVLCPLCDFQAVSATSAKGKSYNICPYCYNNPPSLPDIEEGGRQNSKMPCFECSADCQFAGKQQSIMPCPQCGSGFTIKRKKDGGVFLGCSGYPNCTKTLWLPSELESVSLTGDMCPKCVPKQCRMLNLKFFANRVVPGDPTELVACVGGCDPNITGYLAMANKNFNSFYEKDPATVIPPYFQQGMRPTPEPKRASAAAKRSYDELAENLSASNKRPAYNDRSTNTSSTNYSNNNYNYQNNQWNNNANNNQSFNRNQSGSHYAQDVDQDEDFSSYAQENNQSYSDSYNGPVGDFPEPFDPSESSPMCECQRPAVSKRVTKNNANKGKPFWGCELGVCNFFAWGNDDTGGSRSGGARQQGRGSSYGDRGGYKKGSYSKSGFAGRGQSSRGRGAGSPKKPTSRTCSACGQTGHTKRSCPSLK